MSVTSFEIEPKFYCKLGKNWPKVVQDFVDAKIFNLDELFRSSWCQNRPILRKGWAPSWCMILKIRDEIYIDFLSSGGRSFYK